MKRKLLEETSSEQFKIIKQLNKRTQFKFPKEIQEKVGYDKQETIVYLVEYMGDGDALVPIDDEIDRIEFITKDALFEGIFVEETRK